MIGCMGRREAETWLASDNGSDIFRKKRVFTGSQPVYKGFDQMAGKLIRQSYGNDQKKNNQPSLFPVVDDQEAENEYIKR